MSRLNVYKRMSGDWTGSDESLYLVNEKGRSYQRVEDIKKRVQRQDWAVFKSRLALNPAKSLTGFQKWRYTRRLAWRKLKIKIRDATSRMELWGRSFKKIEGYFGSGVMSYFMFLKWLFLLNLYIFLLVFCFIVIPQVVSDYETDIIIVPNISNPTINLSVYCTSQYDVPVNNDDIWQLIVDFLEGTGWMEKTLMFYGHYTDSTLSLDRLFGAEHWFDYNMPLAYLLVTIAYFILSLVLMCSHTNETLREQLLHGHDWAKARGFLSVTFSGWDYSLTNHEAAALRHKHIYNEIMGSLDELRQLIRRRGRSKVQKCILLLIRIVIHLFVILLLCLSGYVIYIATHLSTEYAGTEAYDASAVMLQLLYDYLPSLAITILNFIVPKIFTQIVKLEDYSADFEIRMTLGRTVFLRLSSLCVLFATLYNQITCDNTDQCGVGLGYDCPEIWCWETYVGQNMYRLMVMFIAVLFGTIFLVEFPRWIIVTYWDNKFIKMVGYPTFDIPKGVLDLVYVQILVWVGTFFAPMLAAIAVILFFIMFYLKKLTVLHNHVPGERPYRSSRSHMFFMIVLIVAYLLCCIPIGFCIYQVHPSLSCGPFRLYDNMWSVLMVTISTWPDVLQELFEFLSSAGFVIPLFVVMCLLIYMLHAASNAKGELAMVLRENLSLSAKDRQYLLTKLNEYEGQGGRRNLETTLPSERAAPSNTDPENPTPNYNTFS